MLIGIEEIEGKYEVLAKLGEGGMGAIYKVRHVLLDEIQVIKTIRPNLQQDQDLQGRFLREAQVAAKLRHPNIATIHDFSFSKSGEAYIVMSFIEGQNIRDYLRSGGRLSIEQVIEVGKQALDALGYLHSKSFVHRDISTDNMMVTWHEGQPHVTLIDLGLAKSLETQQWHTKTGMVVGKVRYISPEQLNAGVEGVEVDARSDLYSMGVVLYELLTGQFPIVGQDDMSLIAGHLYRPPRSFDETDPHAKIPPAIRAAVMKALEKKAEYRYTSAREFAQALDYSLRHGVTAPLPTMIGDQYTVRQVGGPTSGRDPLQADRHGRRLRSAGSRDLGRRTGTRYLAFALGAIHRTDRLGGGDRADHDPAAATARNDDRSPRPPSLRPSWQSSDWSRPWRSVRSLSHFSGQRPNRQINPSRPSRRERPPIFPTFFSATTTRW